MKYSDLGLGNKLGKSGDRLIRQDGSFNIYRRGNTRWNAYQGLLGMSGWQFTIFTVLFFIGINMVFAFLFLYVGIEQLNGVPQGSDIDNFLYAFFFSVQTFTTVGYGGINPVGISANFISSLCASVGLVAFALMTGLLFARFSRPRSHIEFSKIALLTPLRDGHSFQCRLVNRREHKIINLRAEITMTWLEKHGEMWQRRYRTLLLDRNNVILFPLNWTLAHLIDEKSPLHGKTLKDLTEMHAEFLVMVSGFDESYNQEIYANTSYICGEIRENVQFKMMYTTSTNDDEVTELFLDCLSETVPLQE